MKKFRKEDLSIHHYIRFHILNEYIETESDVPLEFLESVSSSNSYVYQASSDMYPQPTDLGRGWVYIDNYGDTTEQQNAITVYDNSSIISGSNYLIDYVDGRVIFSNNLIVPTSVTYKYFYISLVNEWEDVEAAGVPVVVIQLESFFKEGFQLGGGKRVSRRGHFHIFASNRAERDDLMELLYDGIYEKCCPNQVWPKGSMLDWDGTFNSDYVFELPQHNSNLHFRNVSATQINPPLVASRPSTTTEMSMLTDLNKYRARIDFNLFHWEEV